MDPFVTASDLAGLPGAPFSEAAVKAAVDQIRLAAGWHIAPVKTDDQLVVDGSGGYSQWLPTRNIHQVSQVEIWDNGTWGPLQDWDPQTGWSQNGFLVSGTRFPDKPRSVRVTLTHGFPVTDDLKLLVAVATTRRVAAESISSRSITFADTDDVYGTGSILSVYALGPRP